jgi:uroporphyrinogen-III synthase
MPTPILYTGLRPPEEVPEHLVVDHLPLLHAAPIHFDVEPIAHLLSSTCCTLIASSPRAVEALAARSSSLHAADAHPHDAWAVGAQTALAMRAALPWLQTIYTPAHDAQTFDGLRDALAIAHAKALLARHIIQLELLDAPRPLDDLLTPERYTLLAIPVYATQPRPGHELHDLPARADRAQAIVLTSPRAVEALSRHVPRPHAKLVAIGPSTAAAILEHFGQPPTFVPPTPSLNALWGLL